MDYIKKLIYMLKKDEIGKQILKNVIENKRMEPINKQSESDNYIFEKNQAYYLVAIKKVYTEYHYTYRDLVKRKISLKKSSESINPAIWFYFSVPIGILLNLLIEIHLSNGNDNKYINLFIGLLVILSIGVLAFLGYRLLLYYNEDLTQYGTNELEIQIIDSILNESWGKNFNEIKNNILEKGKEINKVNEEGATEFEEGATESEEGVVEPSKESLEDIN